MNVGILYIKCGIVLIYEIYFWIYLKLLYNNFEYLNLGYYLLSYKNI